MRRFDIHLNALRAFEAAARLASFSKAAKELHVSHSTISHHITGLEKSLGRELFLRQNRRVILTNEAENLFRLLKCSFDDISSELEVLKQNVAKNKSLNVTVTPAFANKWLIPNLRSFREVHPDIEVRVHPSLEFIDFNQDKIDVGIRNGLGNWSGLESELLMPVHMTPLCAPSLLERFNGALNPQSLTELTLIHADVSSGTGIQSEWCEWLTKAGLDEIDCTHGLSFKDPSLALQAAIDGLGVAMGYVELAKDDLAKGKLVQPFELVVKHPWSYFIVIPEDNIGDNHTTLFCDWLRQQMSNQSSTILGSD